MLTIPDITRIMDAILSEWEPVAVPFSHRDIAEAAAKSLNDDPRQWWSYRVVADGAKWQIERKPR